MNPPRRVIELAGGFKPLPVPPGFEAQVLPRAPLIYALEPDRGPWSAGGEYGRLVSEQVPSTATAPLGIFSNDHIGKPRKRVLTLVRTDRAPKVLGNWDFHARIVHGVGGAQNEFLCDWTGDVPIVADAVRVDAVFYAVNADAAYAPPNPNRAISIGAFLGEVGGSPHLPPTLTTPYALVADLDTFFTNVPDFARSVMVNVDQSPVASNDFVLQFETSAGLFKQVDVTQEVLIQGCLLPGNTNAVFVVNQSGNFAKISLTFQLGL
jgi:hypothetical protein